MAAYYNEFDPKAAAWLRELVRRDLIAPGDVDERSITEVSPDDLVGYTQCHFFAGIGGWSLALRMAGVSDDEPIWTGSCPCQPFSLAGKRTGDVDWASLRVGGSFSADERHLWPDFHRLIAKCRPAIVFGEQASSKPGRAWLAAVRADVEDLGYALGAADLCAAGVGAPHIRQRSYWFADSVSDRPQGGVREGSDSEREVVRRPIGPRGCPIWDDVVYVSCRDGKSRPLEPGLAPLAHGLPARVVRLRGYGNAIVPEVAATFIKAVLA